MKRWLAVGVAVCAVLFGAGVVMAQDRLGAHLSGVQEVPPILSDGHGFALFDVDYDQLVVRYTVVYFDLASTVTQAHVHFGTPGVNGGIMAFLCSNLLGMPAGVQNCPNGPGVHVISGTLRGADVGGAAAGQGIEAGEVDALMEAISSEAAYVNVHTDKFPAGEIRGQLRN